MNKLKHNNHRLYISKCGKFCNCIEGLYTDPNCKETNKLSIKELSDN